MPFDFSLETLAANQCEKRGAVEQKFEREMKKKKPSFDQKRLKMNCGHFTGLWVEVNVILRQGNWVRKKGGRD